MKKYLIGFFALVLTVGIMAFSNFKNTKSQDQFYWYTPDGLTSLGFGQYPSTGCQEFGEGCAIGFTDDPDDPEHDPYQTSVQPD